MITDEMLKGLTEVGQKCQDNDWIVTLVPGGWIYLNKKYACCTMIEYPGSDVNNITVITEDEHEVAGS